MAHKFLFSIVFLSFFAFDSFAQDAPLESKKKAVMVIHGGAGTILKENMTEEKEAAYLKILNEALDIGEGILKNGGTSQEAVEKTIMLMEDSPLFNAGKGAVFTNAGTNELEWAVNGGPFSNDLDPAGGTQSPPTMAHSWRRAPSGSRCWRGSRRAQREAG